jgi:molybdopterin converting factor small subunit
MKVHLKFSGDARQKFGISDMWLPLQDEATVEKLLTKLEREKGVKLNLENTNIVVLLNGRRIEFVGGLKARLKDLDEIVVMPILAGG